MRFGLLCIEIDVRLTSDGHAGGCRVNTRLLTAVVLHDHGLGRVTDIAEYMGRDGGCNS